MPCVLAVGGLDPGGGAGLLADARAIDKAGAFACGVAAVLTVQSTSGLVRSFPVSAARVYAQAREVLRTQDVRAIKTGALGTIQNVRTLARIADAYPKLPCWSIRCSLQRVGEAVCWPLRQRVHYAPISSHARPS